MPGSSTNDGSGKQPQIRFNITRATGSIPNSKPSSATCQSQPTDNTSPQSIRFNVTRATGSIPKTSTLQDQTNSVESADPNSPNAAPSTTTNQSPQQQATIDTAELPSLRTELPPPPKTENQSSCEQKTSTTTIDEPGQLTIEMINNTKKRLTYIKNLALWMGLLVETFNKGTINYTYKDRTSKSVNLSTATTVFTTVWGGEGEIPTKELLHDALMYAISVINNKNLLLYPSKSNKTADGIIKAYKDLFYQTFTCISESKLSSLVMHLTKFGEKQKNLNPAKDLSSLQKVIIPNKKVKYISEDVELKGSETQAVNPSNAKQIIQKIFNDSDIAPEIYRPLAALCKILSDNSQEKTCKDIILKYYIHALHKFAKKHKDTAPMCQAIEHIIFNRWGLKRKCDKVKTFFKREKT